MRKWDSEVHMLVIYLISFFGIPYSLQRYVDFKTEKQAQNAVKKLDGEELHGAAIKAT